jgi:hypothetical protein
MLKFVGIPQLKFEPDGYPCRWDRPRRPGIIGELRSPAGSRRPSYLIAWRLLYGPRVKLKPLCRLRAPCGSEGGVPWLRDMRV